MVHGMVKEVRETEVELRSGDKIPYGLCVWSTGVGARTSPRAHQPECAAGGTACWNQRLRHNPSMTSTNRRLICTSSTRPMTASVPGQHGTARQLPSPAPGMLKPSAQPPVVSCGLRWKPSCLRSVEARSQARQRSRHRSPLRARRAGASQSTTACAC